MIFSISHRVGDFEFTPECGIFDLLSIKLYHGWLFDPQCVEYKDAVGNLSYNQLVEKIVASKETSNDSDLSAEGVCILETWNSNRALKTQSKRSLKVSDFCI